MPYRIEISPGRSLSLLFVSIFLGLIGSTPGRAEQVPFPSDRWTIEGEEIRVGMHDGRESLYLRQGRAVLNGVSYENGSIEFDIQFSSERGFMGGFWRQTDPRNREEFYMRPHQSGQVDANQYTPVFHGNSGWQLYHGPGYGAPVRYKYDKWFHVRILFSGSRAEVYVDSEEPTLVVRELKHPPAAGSVGVMASFAPAYYANFEYTVNDVVRLRGTAPSPPDMPENVVHTWEVSNGFSQDVLAASHELDPALLAAAEWQRLDVEDAGFANLARLVPLGQASNTTFARIPVTCDEAKTVAFSFGYSDVARVYLNGRQLYYGSNAYQSRDYRYLGTIGFFDQVILPLRAGRNELVIAVSESFGGWGVMGRFPEPDGISWGF